MTTDTDPLLAAVEAPRVQTFEREETLDKWVSVLPDRSEYESAATPEALVVDAVDHRDFLRKTAEWLDERGGNGSKVPAPPMPVSMIHRVIHTITVTTITTTESRHVWPKETR